jgi:hypothetical protein
VWVVIVVTCVIFNAIHQCGTVLLAREKQQSLLFVVDSPYHMTWYYSATRVTFDPAKFLPSFQFFAKFQTWQPSLNLAQALPSSSLAAKILVSVCFLQVPSMMSAKFTLGCQIGCQVQT